MGNIKDLIERYRPEAPHRAQDPPVPEKMDYNPLTHQGQRKKIRLTVRSGIKIHIRDLPPQTGSGFLSGLKKRFTFKNPAYKKALKHQLTPPDEYIYAYYIDDAGNLILPRASLRTVIDYFQASRIGLDLVDKSVVCKAEGDIRATTSLSEDSRRVFTVLYGKRFGIVIGDGGDGEKVVAAHLIAFRGQRTMIVVKRTWQLYVWQKILTENTSLASTGIGIVGDRHCEPDRPVVIGIDRTLYKYLPEIADRFGFLIIDRCDIANLKIFYRIVGAVPCRYLLGVAEAQHRQDNLTGFMKLFLGDTTARLQPRRQDVASPVLRVVKTGYEFFGEQYDAVLSDLCDYADRTSRVVADILEVCSKNKAARVVVISVRKGHLENISSELADNYRQSVVVTGRTRPSRIRDICDEFNSGGVRVILTTNKTLAAIRVDPVDAVFIVAPFKYKDVAAAVVRALRPGGQLVEYLDDHPFFIAALKKRISIYKRLGVECSVDF